MAAAPRSPAEINPSTLTEDELTYELIIRGVECRGKGSPELVELLLAHGDDLEDVDVIPQLNLLTEIENVTTKVEELEVLLTELTKPRTTRGTEASRMRVTSLYVHVSGRIRRFMFRLTGGSFKEVKALVMRLKKVQQVLTIAFLCWDFPVVTLSEDFDLEKKMKELQIEDTDTDSDDTVSKLSSQESKRSSQEGKGTSKKKRKRKSPKYKKKQKKEKKKRRYSSSSSDSTDSSTTTSSSSSSSSEKESHKKRHGRHGRTNPVSKFDKKLTFSGEGDLERFLESVEEQAELHYVSSQELLRGIGTLLDGKALIWFRYHKASLKEWKTFKKRIKCAFQPGDQDEATLGKLRNLRQHEEETFPVYHARAEELFRRLSHHLKTREKLRYLMTGLHLFYRSRIVSPNIKSIWELSEECRAMEADKLQILKLEKEEQRRKDFKEGAFRKSTRVSAVDYPTESASCTEDSLECQAVEAPRGSVYCWRCRSHDHEAKDCKNKIFCESCGEKDTTTERCQRCALAQQRGLWSKASRVSDRQENVEGSRQRGSPGPATIRPPTWPPNQFRRPPPPLAASTPIRAPLILQRPKPESGADAQDS